MHAGNRNAVFEAHQLGEHLRPLDYGNMELVSASDLGVFGGNRGTGDDNLGIADILDAMAFEDCGAESGKALRHRGTLQVRARHLVAEIQQDLSDSAHADPTNAYEMNTLDFCEHKIKYLATDLRRCTPVEFCNRVIL